MNSIQNIFKNIDQLLFSKLDLLKTSDPFQKLQSFISSFPENQQKLLYYGFGLLIMLPPIFIVFIFFINTSLSFNEVTTKKQILNEIHTLLYQKEQITQLNNRLTSPQSPTDQRSLHALLAGIGIPSAKISIKQFGKEVLPAPSKMFALNATVGFSNLSMNEMVKLFDGATSRYKILIKSLQINKNNNTQLVEGEFQIRLFGKS